MNFTLRFLILLFLFLSVNENSYAQKVQRLKYQIPLLRRAKHDTTKINILLENLGLKYENIDMDSAIYFYNVALNIAQTAVPENDTIEEKYLKYQVNAYRYIGILNRTQGLYDMASRNYLKALGIADKLDDQKNISLLYTNLGNVYYEEGSFDKALDYFRRALKINRDLNDIEGKGLVFSCMGSSYLEKKNYKKSLEYNLKALKISIETNDKEGLCYSYTNLGLISKIEKQYAEALAHFDKGLNLALEMNDKSAIAHLYENIGSTYLAMSTDRSADTEEVSYDLKKSLEYGLKGYRIAVDIGLVPQQNTLANHLQETYREMGDFKSALKYSDVYIETNDKMFKDEKNLAVLEMESKYNYHKNQRELEKLSEKNKIQDLKVNRQRIIIYFFIGGTLLIFSFSIALYRLLKSRKRTARLITEKNRVMLEQTQMITESINYAKRIQEVIFPSPTAMQEILGEHFVIFKAKDIVSGDFYWSIRVKEYIIFAVADCTGHGVPGALMSMIGTTQLNDAILNPEVEAPSQALNIFRKTLIKSLNQKGEEGEQKDGVDVALCAINTETMELNFAGAFMPCYVLQYKTKELIKLQADRMPIGIHPVMGDFTSHSIKVEKGDLVYMMSDGFQDQFGGPRNQKFSSRRITQYLMEIHEKPLSEQKELLSNALFDWQNNHGTIYEQTDDITLLAMKIDF
jgi:serine phosphatase RsbU (regulator of sigma subunit)/tetratricopeptide (TPR) repeat protein